MNPLEDEYPFTTATLTESLGYKNQQTTLRHAARLNLGIDLGGRAGKRYSHADRQKIIDSLRPAAPVKGKRKGNRRRAA